MGLENKLKWHFNNYINKLRLIPKRLPNFYVLFTTWRHLSNSHSSHNSHNSQIHSQSSLRFHSAAAATAAIPRHPEWVSWAESSSLIPSVSEWVRLSTQVRVEHGFCLFCLRLFYDLLVWRDDNQYKRHKTQVAWRMPHNYSMIAWQAEAAAALLCSPYPSDTFS